MFHFQDSLIFPTHAVPKAGPMPTSAEELSLEGEGQRLSGVYIPPERKSRGGPDLILGFGGNAWNAQDVAEYLHEVLPSHAVAAFHYRGYRPSSGSPSADALIADAPRIHDFVVDRFKPRRIIAVGFSIGTGVAAQLAANRALDGVILVTPFDSLKAVAQGMYPWIPIGPFFTHEIDAATPLRETRVPVAVIAAERDELIPAERTEALRANVRNLVFDRTIAGAGHNAIYARSDFHDALREAVTAIGDQ